MKYRHLIQLGISGAYILKENSELLNECHLQYLRFRKRSSFMGSSMAFSKEESIRTKKYLQLYIKSKIKEINQLISVYNSHAEIINPQFKIGHLKQSLIQNSIKPYFKFKSDINTEILPHVVESFDQTVSRYLNLVSDELIQTTKVRDQEIRSFNLVSLPSEYKQSLEEVVDLYLLKYESTALLVLGRIFEEIITKYLWKLVQTGKITKTKKQIYGMRFEDKLNIIKSQKIIPEKDWLIITKLKFDRNIGGHFSKGNLRRESISEAEHTIKLALKLVNKYYKKIKT